MASLYCSPVNDNIEKFDCGLKKGGLFGQIYAANLGDVQEISSTLNDKEMDTIIMRTNPITTQPYFWYSIAFKKGTAGLANEVQFGNNKFVNQTITFMVEGITKTSLKVLEQMVDGEAVFIAKDANGNTHVLGRITGLESSVMTYGTGTAADDIYGGTITFSSSEPEFSNLVKVGTQIQVLDSVTGLPVTVTL
jgi:hypothetical protein